MRYIMWLLLVLFSTSWTLILSSLVSKIRDEHFCNQWHIWETPMNILQAQQLGFTGRNVTISILSDNIGAITHPDLIERFHSKGSYYLDINAKGKPIVFLPESNATLLAGVALATSNEKCGIGVAFNASLAMIRLPAGIERASFWKANVTYEAYALTYNFKDRINPNSIVILAFSQVRNRLNINYHGLRAQDAFKEVSPVNPSDQYRRVFVIGSGDSGSSSSCAYDGYVNNKYVIAVAGLNESNMEATYSEGCSAVFTTAYSSKLATIFGVDCCAKNATGTSVAASLVAGVIAMAFNANPSLTYRDIQYLIVYNSLPEEVIHLHPTTNDGKDNAVGLYYSYKHGFGILDAYKMVVMSKQWSSNSNIIRTQYHEETASSLSNSTDTIFYFDLSSTPIKQLESVFITSSWNQTGALCVFHSKLVAISPNGTIAFITFNNFRPMIWDVSKWTVKALNFWGESPRGLWKIIVEHATNSSGVPECNKYDLVITGLKANLVITKLAYKQHDRKEVTEKCKNKKKTYNQQRCLHPNTKLEYSRNRMIMAIALGVSFAVFFIVIIIIVIVVSRKCRVKTFGNNRRVSDYKPDKSTESTSSPRSSSGSKSKRQSSHPEPVQQFDNIFEDDTL